MNLLISLFSPYYPRTLVYMLQSTEYQVKPYLQWWRRTQDFSKVAYRRQLVPTRAAQLLLWALYWCMAAQLVAGVGALVYGLRNALIPWSIFGLVLIATYPLVWAFLVTVPLILGRWLIVNPRQRREVKAAEQIFAKHSGQRLAVAGSYGKTSMKELLNTVLSEGKKVAATPANKNVSVSHAAFARKLKGDEDILIIEYGEGGPDDVARFCQNTHPTMGVITGLAPAHLDHYPSLKAAGQDIFSLAEYVGGQNAFVNKESPAATDFIKPGYQTYDDKAALGWKISDVKVSFDGTKFTMKKGSRTLKLRSALLGRHQVGPLALTAALADKFGLTDAQIKKGIGQTKPFEHRMQPRPIHGAWIIDDTYNGNIDGLKAGLRLLAELPAKRRIYVTPGLVDQGVEASRVHQELGWAIAKANPDVVVLMQNSATADINTGLEAGNYKGEVQIELAPLEYYSNLEHLIAAGDVVMLQNDWTDNYN